MAEYNFAVLIRNCAKAIGSGIEQCDAAVMAGARSATTIMVKKEQMVIRSVSEDVANDFPVAADQLVRLLHPKENDAIVIGGSDDSRKAEYGALAAAWTLLERCRGFSSEGVLFSFSQYSLQERVEIDHTFICLR